MTLTTVSVSPYWFSTGRPNRCSRRAQRPVSINLNFVIALNKDRISNSSELIQSPKLDEFVAFIRETLVPDVILFDLPPMLPSDDAMAMLPKIDGALLVAAAGVTKVPEIQSCEGQISQLGKLLGIALNKSDVAPEEYS